MRTFEIKHDFLLNGEPLKIISGAIHYFRMTQPQWEDSLYNLKALGANTVETYVPWNLHEPQEGQFDFSDEKDITAFLDKAAELGLLVILRPSPYICAEWEFGGFPYWLLNTPNIRLRSTDPVYMEKVDNYLKILLKKVNPYQITNGGPIVMMQVENEYGSYGMEKAYLRQLKDIMIKHGVNVPLFTADGSWDEVLDAGTLIEDDVFVTGNFGSKSIENSEVLQAYFDKYQKDWPIMCMEYWDGWFNRWGEEIIKRDPEELGNEIRDMLKMGSLNLYMFHGGSNFGFYNGTSVRGDHDLPQVTSYDYDALLTEWGQPTEKFYAVQRAIKDVCPDVPQFAPREKVLSSLGTFPMTNSVSLFATAKEMAKEVTSTYPLTMEELQTGLGYVLYDFDLKNYRKENTFKILETSDRVQIFANGEKLATQYQEEIGEELTLRGDYDTDEIHMELLVENVGRVNYGYKLNAPSQRKGIRRGVMQDIHFHQGFKQYGIDLTPEQVAKIDFSKESNPLQPSFYQSIFELEEVGDTFIDCSNYGKGAIIVNGRNLGRYNEEGPFLYIYCPKEFLNKGTNEIIILETEGKEIKEVSFVDEPIFKKIEK